MILRKSAAQEGAFNLAGLLSNVMVQNLIKPDIRRRAVATNDDILEAFSGLRIGLRILINPKFFSHFVTSTRTGLFAPVRAREEGFSNITTRGGKIFLTSPRDAGNLCNSTRAREGEFLESIKKGLLIIANPVYGYSAPAKSGAGRGNPLNIKATQTPIASFFVSCHSAHQFSGNARNVSMVALAGLPKGRPVSFVSGISTPVNVTTPLERGNSGGDSLHTKEAAIMATTPTQNPQFIWLIAAVRRDMPTIIAKIHHIAAETEREARRTLARDHVCFFAGRIRLEVAA
ncbi:host cell division inhibitor Icd-like protein [Enterobacter hormaechei]|uniref:host cell division inhibitor Icd-like protein n=1 Tax=Enterobacter hormaechei TaxID=158836 RepID=UPI00294A6FC9|nr:host cell division inhibitor Icd-like protein [Enterobacter hormaechei]MDV5368580.1 host cell division inhibitor Icd-like protein [Enterobacter hormaechei]